MAIEDTKSAGRDESESDPIIEVRNLNVRFEMDRGISHVLNDVNVDIERQELFGVIGESGSGKSMFADALLNAVVNPGKASGEIIYHPEEGDPINILELEGEALRKFRWENVSMVFQGAMESFNPTMTFRGHFKETLKYHGYDLDEGMERADQLISDLHLDPKRVLNSYPHELSGGMRQRVLIALSLILEPEVVVMDEPTAALDLLMQRSIMSLIYNIQQERDLTIVFITHDLPLVAGLSDRLAVLYGFEFIEIGPANEVKRNPHHPYLRSLIKAVPSIDSPIEEMQAIDGSTPDPVNLPQGCSYHKRCPMATQECVDVDPSLSEATSGRRVACHHWRDASDAIPFNFLGGDDE